MVYYTPYSLDLNVSKKWEEMGKSMAAAAAEAGMG